MAEEMSRNPIVPLDARILAMRQDFDTRISQLQDAKEGWGIRPDHPEDYFVRALIGAQEGLVEVMLSTINATWQMEEHLRQRMDEEVAKQMRLTEQIQATMRRADMALGAASHQANLRLDHIKTDTARLATELVDKMVNKAAKAFGERVVILEKRLQVDLEWGRWGKVGLYVLLVFMFGFAVSEYAGWDNFKQAYAARSGLMWCDEHPAAVQGDTKYCDIALFRPR